MQWHPVGYRGILTLKKITFSGLVAVCLAALCVGGSLRVMFDFGRWIYLAPIFLLLVVFMLRAGRAKVLSKGQFFYLLLLLLFGAWLLFTSIWTVSTMQWREDALLLMVLVLIPILATLLADRATVKAFLKMLVVFGVLVGAFVIYKTGTVFGATGYGTVVNRNYLTLAPPVAMALIISVVYSLYAERSRVRWGFIALFLVVALSLSIARGALLFSIFAILLLGVMHLIIGPQRPILRIKYWCRKHLFFVLPLVGLLMYLALNVQKTSSKLFRMLDPAQEYLGGRGGLFEKAWESISYSPIWGYGLGSSGLMSGTSDQGYPHNLLLEVWLDGGVIALVIILLLLAYPFMKTLKGLSQKWDPHLLCLFCLLVFWVLEYLKSHSFYSARPLFIVIALIMLYTQVGSSKISSKPNIVGHCRFVAGSQVLK